MHPSTIALEKLCRERRQLGKLLLSLDMHERWGNEADRNMNKALEKAEDLSSRAIALDNAIETSVAELDYAARSAWCEAHIQLLDDLIQKTEAAIAAGNDQHGRTKISVATDEKAGWNELKNGKLSRVKQNLSYISYDAALFEEIFGFPPS